MIGRAGELSSSRRIFGTNLSAAGNDDQSRPAKYKPIGLTWFISLKRHARSASYLRARSSLNPNAGNRHAL